jgi:CRP-like cAMP-binding protein
MEQALRQQIEQIVKLTDEEFSYVLSHFAARKFKKNQYLIQAGDAAPNDYFVTRGLLKSSFTDEQGKEHIMQFAMEDWWISDPQAYHNSLKATLNVSCLEDTDTYYISLDNREKICADLRKMEYFFRKKTQTGYIALQRRILSLMSQSAKERYDQFLQLYPQLLQRVPKTLIASYLGISRETLSRLAND